jgi:hypothetical protein
LTAGNYNVTATDEDSNALSKSFAVSATVISLSSTSGNSGDTVTVTGSGFKASADITITFGTIPITNISAQTGSDGALNTSFVVPEVSVGIYTVKVSDGTNTKEASFGISTSADISPVTSASSPGSIGSNLVVSGTGFTRSGTVTAKYDGVQIGSATADSSGAFSITFTVPASPAGQHSVVVSDGKNTQNFSFYVETTPPAKPKLLLPETGTKADAQTIFDWEDVSDPSGVTYTLAIFTDPSSEEAAKTSQVLEVKDIVGSQYTLTKEQKLSSVNKDTPYYWRVKATDGASNAGQWSDAMTFYIGFSMGVSQPVIYVIIGVFAVALAVFAFWMGRKTAYY